jgi:putative ABC transport system permease protein
MLKNYILTATRSLLRNKGFSTLNILGLSIGLASFVLITLYVYHELSFDRYHARADRIFRIVENLRTENEMLFQSTSSPPMGPTLLKDFPEVENYVRFQQWNLLVTKDQNAFYEPDSFIADSTVFDVFSFPLVKGNPKTALTEPYSVVLTESMVKKYFGDADPVGQLLKMDNDQFKVTGVAKDVPENSHFQFNFLISFSTWSSRNKQNEMRAWFWNGFHTYLLLRDKQAVTKVRGGIAGYITRNIEKGGMYYEDLPLQPLTSIYLETPRSWENGKRGSVNNIYILSIIAVFILVIASFNYVNLATARASRRLKEVGLRKVLGAQRRTLIAQFLGESIIVSMVSSVVGVALAWLALPVFNELLETSLSFSVFTSPLYFVAAVALLAFVLGLMSGAYPALVISGFQPLQIFRPAVSGMFSHQRFRKVLVAAQFVISITLVAGTVLVFNQLTMVRSRDLGFTRDATLILPTNGDTVITNHLETVKHELMKVDGVISVAGSAQVPGQPANNWYSEIEVTEGKMSPTNINTNMVDHDFIPGYDIKMIAGRNFSRDNKADDTTAFILNETAVKDFNWTLENAIGRRVNQGGRNGSVIGVTRDFHYASLHHAVAPLLLRLSNRVSRLSIRLKSDNLPATVDQVGEKWRTLAPGLPYTFSFLDQSYDKQYKADTQLGSVASVFTGLAIIVGCLGLLGLTSFSVERRVKEIGIRKVLGASIQNVMVLIAREFVVLIGIAFVVAVPVTWYLVSKWLTNFTEHIVIGPWPFMAAGLFVLTIACLTISWLSFNAASSNPTEALRNE